MGDAQALVAKDISALLQTERDIRIGITTTDSGNPRCPAVTTTPEGGKLQTRNCLERVDLGEFEYNAEDHAYACWDVCGTIDWTIAPTSTAYDGSLAPRAWFERTGGVANVDGGELIEAVRCALPQGVNGCGHEQPLESMFKALAQAQVNTSPNYGFLRDEADLVVVIVTDEVDCSYNPKFGEIFTTNKVFWSDPAAPNPTSALCFNAGVECEGSGPTYSTCSAVDKDTTGAVTSDPAEAVLQPVSKYIDFLAGIQAQKTGGARVRLVAIAGVPQGFESGAPLVFEDDPDPVMQDQFGIGPGCVLETPGGSFFTARPPVRLLEVGESLGALEFYSICEPSYQAALAAIAQP